MQEIPLSEKTGQDSLLAGLVIIGNEVLSGRTRDANLQFIAQQFEALGVQLIEAAIVRDTAARIQEALRRLQAEGALVITTGGIGPTHDDITTQTIADYLGLPLEEHEPTARRMRAYYASKGLEWTQARRKMACLPKGALPIANEQTLAPGFAIQGIYALPGVPKILQTMFPVLRALLPSGPVWHEYVLESSLPEGTIAASLARVQARFRSAEIGSYPQLERPGPDIVIRHTQLAVIKEIIALLYTELESLGGDVHNVYQRSGDSKIYQTGMGKKK